MTPRFTLPAIFLLLLIPASIPTPAQAFEVDVGTDTVNVTIQTNISQNLTGLLPRFQFPPNVSSTLQGANATQAAEVFQNALRALSPSATVTDFTLTFKSDSFPGCKGDFCNPQWFNVTARFTLTGILSTQGGTTEIDLAWKSFRVSDEIQVGNVTINRLGEVYLQSAVLRLLEITPTADRNFRTLVNDIIVTFENYQTLVSGIVSFDLSSLSAPIQGWKENYDFSTGRSTWETDSTVGFKVEGIGVVYEPERTFVLLYEVASRSSAKVTAVGVSRASGDTLIIEREDAIEPFIMTAAISSVIVIGLASYLTERRLGRIKYRKKK